MKADASPAIYRKSRNLSDSDLLSDLQRVSLDYFINETNPENGLVRDRNRDSSPASIAAVGLALTAWPVGVARGMITRADAIARTLTTLRFLWNAPQGPERNASGHRGFFYHFLDMETGRRAWRSELSTIDTALLMAGVLSAAAYFREDDKAEAEIRDLADKLYSRVDWRWALNGGGAVSHGWTSERGFLRYRWHGYDEALILYILGLGSPTHALPPESYAAWLSTYKWKTIYGHELVYAGPLFIHQLSHIWIDFRGIADPWMRDRQTDYFENSRRATYVQREYAMRNPHGFVGYGQNCWGITACDGPGPLIRVIDGVRRRFYGYRARGVPWGADDGTLSPWATAASLPFAPEIVIPALRHFHAIELEDDNPYGFTSGFNPTIEAADGRPCGWMCAEHVGVNQGPMALMIENHRSDFVWTLMRTCPYVEAGLRRAGFAGGWLDR